MSTLRRPIQRLAPLAAVVLIGGATRVSACSVCFGNPESNQTEGMNMAILTLLGITLTVLGTIATFAVLMIRRADAIRETQDNTIKPTAKVVARELSHG